MQISGVSGLGDTSMPAATSLNTDASVAAEGSSTDSPKVINMGNSLKQDLVTISEEARKLSGGGAETDSTGKKDDSMVQSVKDRIKELQEELQELQGSDLPEKEKQQQMAALNQEIASQTATLQELQEQGVTGGGRYGKGGLTF